ncbi:hypothetical protein GSY74_10510 [Sulfurovum sp. bin170]|uniref:hypothetical protein n=1 Tax=Sulfurovum sp. bin170 TaxID=2695268 RepID=UPI0013DEBA89|nr:hypothetical protein [Sulfurovum sp. bin170]NEW61718.1 hypothetical protein [Sulfurovum sp. bin170]
MESNMYIYAFSNHTEEVTETLSNKKMHLKKRVNRADNYINLTLLGAEKCIEDTILAPESSLYVASNNGNLNSSVKILKDIFLNKQLPMPFTFLNGVNVSTLFYVAKHFNIKGKTLFVDRFESAIPQAFVDVKNGKTVLLGMVDEATEDLELYRDRFQCETITESSRWLLLLPQPQEDTPPIAQIIDIAWDESSEERGDVAKLFTFLEEGEGVFDFKQNSLSFRVVR